MRIIILILAAISSISASICSVWTIVSFLIYLVKDNPFNWTVFWIGIFSIICLITFNIVLVFFKESTTEKLIEKRTNGKSKFKERLEAAQELQNKRRNGIQ